MFYIALIEVIIRPRTRSVGKPWENVIVTRDINNIITLLFMSLLQPNQNIQFAFKSTCL